MTHLAAKALLLISVLFIGVVVTSALSPDSRLLQLVPPNSQVVAGMRASTTSREQPSSLLLITPSSSIDLQDFFAVTGSDPSRVIRQVIFVIGAGDGALSEHSLLVSGAFNRNAIMKGGAGERPGPSLYRGIAMELVPPLKRERQSLSDLRGLVILDSNIAIFGTIASVQRELDRYLDHSTLDSILGERLNRLRRKDDSWCLVAAPLPERDIQAVLGILDPDLGPLLRTGGIFEFGIRFDERVVFEYEIITPSSDVIAQNISSSFNLQLAGPNRAAQSFIPRASLTVSDGTIHGTVKVSRSRYEQWIGEIATRDRVQKVAPSQ